jgi:hypothetical protein
MRNAVYPCNHTTHPLAAPEKLDTTETLDLELALTLARPRTRGQVILVGERIEREGVLQGGMGGGGWGEGRVEGEFGQGCGRGRRIRVVCVRIWLDLHGVEAEQGVVIVLVGRVGRKEGIKVEHLEGKGRE